MRLQLFYFFQCAVVVCKYFSETCPDFFINVYAYIKKLKIMIAIFKNLLAYQTLIVWSLITMLHIGLEWHGGLYLVKYSGILGRFLS